MKSRTETTKFILGGGFARKSPDKGQALYNEIVKDLPDSLIVLAVLYALPKKDWDGTIKRNESLFSSLVPNKEVEFHIANLETIKSQIMSADIVFLHGGTASSLIESLENVPNLREALKGKVVVGVSAGAYALSELYLEVSNEGGIKLREGLGFLPLSMVTHYGSNFYENKYPGVFNWKLVDELLTKNSGNNEILTLKEGEYVIFHESEN